MRAPAHRRVLPRHTSLRQLLGALALLAALSLSAPASAQDPLTIFDRAVADFLDGRVAQSVTEFDDLARRMPDQAPQLWQRGIALYYVGRYDDCRAQFESHRTVNPADVENAAWHFACVARAESPGRARKTLLPVGPDPRRPMREIYQMFAGSLEPERVMTAAGGRPESEFYAHLYVGLFYEASGDTRRALEHIAAAADDRYGAAGGYMHRVAQIHLGILRQGDKRQRR